VESVERSGEACLLTRGERVVAVLTPVNAAAGLVRQARRRTSKGQRGDALLNIIGIGASAEPTDIANHKREYLADAYETSPSP